MNSFKCTACFAWLRLTLGELTSFFNNLLRVLFGCWWENLEFCGCIFRRGRLPDPDRLDTGGTFPFIFSC